MDNDKRFLFESFLSKAESRTREYIREYCMRGLRPYLNTPVNKLPDDIGKELKSLNPDLYDSCAKNDMNLLNYFRLYLEAYFDIRYGKGPVRYLPGIARIACSELNMFNEKSEDSELSDFKKDVLFLYNNPEMLTKEYDKNLNGVSYEDFSDEISPVRKSFNAEKRKSVPHTGKNERYKIVPITSAEQAAEYSPYTDWCVTQKKSHYDDYTRGGRRFYFCIENGFDLLDDTPGKNCPLDEYGLSMISVLIDSDGEPDYITTRWNHRYDGENNVNFRTAEQFTEVTGIPFYETFKPYTVKELREMGITPFSEVQRLIDSGESIYSIFDSVGYDHDGIRKVSLNDKVNYICGKHLISGRWFDDAKIFENDFGVVKKGGLFNAIRSDGTLLSDTWFSYMSGFGYSVTGTNFLCIVGSPENSKLCNLIDRNGNILLKEWVSAIVPFTEGYTTVRKDDKYNVIDTEGNFVSRNWFDYIANVWNDDKRLFCVERNGKYNIMDTGGNVVFPVWFDNMKILRHKRLLYVVEKDGKYNIINLDGDILFPVWFDSYKKLWLDSESDYVWCVEKDGKWNIFDPSTEKLVYDDFRKLKTDEYGSIIESVYSKREEIGTLDEVLNEGAVDDRVKKYIRENCASEFEKYLDTCVRDLPGEYKKHLKQMDSRLYDSCIEHGTKLIDYFRIHLMKEFDINRDKGPVKYLRGIARIACEDLDFFRHSANVSDIALFKQLVLFVFNNPEELKIQYDSNLNGLSFDEFKRQVNDIRKAFNLKMRSKTGNIGTVDRKYKVVAINSKKEAEKYGKYTKWCITHGSYDSYAKNGSRFYFCLGDGFEKVKRVAGPGCPLDRYGLSMVSVLIDMDGEPTIITTRWNHDHDGENNENFHTVEQFEKVMGIPFYKTFKPYTKEELKKMGIISVEEAKERLSKGESPNNIFDYVGETLDGWSRVSLNDKWNFINSERQLLSDIWFNYVFSFKDGFATVKNKNDEWNFVSTKGELLSDVWFKYVNNFREGFADVKNKNDEWNFIDIDGKFISDVWFKYVYNFHEGFAAVQNKNYEWNFINTNGKFISDVWFEYVNDFHEGFARVQNKNDELNFINTKGELLSDVWFEYISDFVEGFAVVQNENKEWNYINTNGKFISDVWFRYADADAFKDGFAKVIDKNDEIKYLDTEGKLYDHPVKESLSEHTYMFHLNEGAVDDKVKKYIRENCASEFEKYLDTGVRDLPGEYKNHLKQMDSRLYDSCIEHNTRLIDYFRIHLMKEFDINRGKGPIKYLRGIARIACEDLDFFRHSANVSDIALFKQLVLFVFNNPGELKTQYDSNLNGLSFDEFKRQVNDIRKAFNLKMRSKTGKVEGSGKYKVIAINGKEEAEKYGKYTTWCITHGSYDSYAKGGSRFYFCLEDGFENIKREAGPGCPLDKYGLSMVSVLIDMDGEPTIITTRWNHDYDGENNENFRTVEQFEKVMGIPFYETFKPYTEDELKKMGIISVEEAKERLLKGEKPNDIFDYVGKTLDGWSRVRLNDKWNFVNSERRLLSDVWFVYADDFYEGFAVVKNKNNERNFVNTKGELLSDVWFKAVGNFHEGFAAVKNKNGEWNFINTKGELLSDVWFKHVNNFRDGFAAVKNKNDEWNFINTKGELLSDIRFEYLVSFKDGFAAVKNKNDEWNFINTKGELISDVWFNDVSDFHEGFVSVQNKNDKWNFINTKGELLSDVWFNDVGGFYRGFAKVIDKNDTKKYIDTKGKLHDRPVKESLSEGMFYNASSFRPKSELNQKLWDDNMELDRYARRQMLLIARDFIRDLDIDDFKIEDILMTGSLANYNWDEDYSDIDLHILVDFDKVGDDREISKKMFDAVRKEWNNIHGDITIFGYPVEVYVQDTKEEHRSSGVYSLLYGKWIRKPDVEYMNVNIDDELIDDIAGNYENDIDTLHDLLVSAETDEDFENVYNRSIRLYDEIKSLRKKGMSEDKPEMSTGNLIFKTLRRNGCIEKLLDIRNGSYDKLLSI